MITNNGNTRFGVKVELFDAIAKYAHVSTLLNDIRRGCRLVDLDVEERKISITIPPKTSRFQTGLVNIPKGEVWRIIEIVSLSRPAPDLEFALHIAGVPQARVTAGSVYIENEAKGVNWRRGWDLNPRDSESHRLSALALPRV